MLSTERELLLRVLFETAPYTGEEFLDALCGEVAAACDVKIVAVTEILLAVNKARTVCAYRNRQPMEVVEYELAGTPCGTTLEQGVTTIFADHVLDDYPDDEWLAAEGAQSYIATPLRSASDDIIGLLTVIHDRPIDEPAMFARMLEDISTRAGAELERIQRGNVLRFSEARLRLLAENCRDVLFFFQLDPEPGFKYVSPAVETLSGVPPEAFLANSQAFLQMIHADDRPKVSRAMTTAVDDPITARLITVDGETRWIEYRTFAVPDPETSGAQPGICGSIRDISVRVRGLEALELSEQYRRAILAAMPDTLLRLAADGTMLDYVSSEGAQALPASAKELLGRNIRDLLPPNIAGPIRAVELSALQSKRSQRTEFEVGTASRTIVYEARCVPFRDSEVLVILRDFTAVKWHEGEGERHRLRDELDGKVEPKRANLYNLTYRELAILHLIADGQSDKQIADSLGVSIYTVNKHVGNILGKMMAASRTEAGVRAIREGIVD